MCAQLPWYRDKHFYFVKKEFGLCLLFALFSLERLVFDTGSGFFGALPGELEGYAVPWKVPREFFLTQVRSTVGGSTGVFLFYAGRVVPWEAHGRFLVFFLFGALLPVVRHVKYNGSAHYCAALRWTAR